MDFFGIPLSAGTAVTVLLALGLALLFEFVNGFHDTANAVATVIYTHSLKPNHAVIWSGLWNLIGVLTSSGAVAFSVTALLPVELILNVGSAAGFAMVFALLISAMTWNLGTWYFGIPASSSHSLIGSVLGVGMANSMMLSGGPIFGEGVNWAKANEVGLSLLISPLAGFCGAAALLLLTKRLIKRPELYRPPAPGQPPPGWIRGLLIATCTGVSFAHGSNDGQKGMGLIMLILVGLLPGFYALNLETPATELPNVVASLRDVERVAQRRTHGAASITENAVASSELSGFLKTSGTERPETWAALGTVSGQIGSKLANQASLSNISVADRRDLRSDLYLVAETIGKLDRNGDFTDNNEREQVQDARRGMDRMTKFIPPWVKLAVAIALGLGTMIGWKRIVVTVGEKIGKEHLSYAQGAAAEAVAMITIGAADIYGLPVSTTHVLSSGVAGTMAANASGLQAETLRNLALAWLLTLPVCVFLGAMLFALALNLLIAVGLR